MKAPEAFGEGDGVAGSNLPVMQDDSDPLERPGGRGRARRDAGAGRPRRALVSVDLRRRAGRHRFRRRKAEATPPDNILGEPAAIDVGDAEAALARGPAPGRPDLPHAAPQPQRHRAARRDRRLGGRRSLTVHDATQMITQHRGLRSPTCSASKADQVRVLSPFVGGGFGNKGLWSHQILAAAAAKLARPAGAAGAVAARGCFALVGGRTTTEQRVALAAARGRSGSTALIHTGVAAMTRTTTAPSSSPSRPAISMPPRTVQMEQKVARHGHDGQHLDARARRIGRHLRAGVRDRRAGARR